MDYFKRNYLTAEGRLNRWKYFKLLILLALIEGVIFFFIGIFFTNFIGGLTATGDRLSLFLLIAFTVLHYFLMTRRLHDIGKDNFLAKVIAVINVYFIIFVDEAAPLSVFDSILTFIACIIGLYLLLKRGMHGYNQYGSDPLEQ